MPTISPSTASIHRGSSKQFTGSGISSGAIWTLYGSGSIDQNGLYVAPAAGGGPSGIVSYHTTVWEYFPPQYFTRNADDSLTKITNEPGYYGQVSCLPKLAAAGDSVEFVSHVTNPYWVGLRNTPANMECVFFGNDSRVREYHPSGPLVQSAPIGIGQGDVLRIEIIPGGKVMFSVNGVPRYTSVYIYYTASQTFVMDAAAGLGTLHLPPRFNGPTINANYLHAEANFNLLPEILLPYQGCELYCEPHMQAQAEGSGVPTLNDYSGMSRNLTAASPVPTFRTNVTNGKSVVRFDGAQQPLRNSSAFPVRCGFVVAKYNAAAFPDYKGLLTSFVNHGVLVGNIGDVEWFDWINKPMWEFRSHDRIYPQSAYPGPMNQFKVLFFRFWDGPVTFDGIQLGADRNFAGRLWNGDVALLALYSRDFTEEEIRAHSQKLATHYGLPALAEVYPYQADVSDTAETSLRTVNLYDPPEGDRIVEVLDAPKRLLNLKFSVAGEAEARAMKKFHRDHYPEVPCLYRDYRFTPPEDIEGYINSPYDLEGSTGDFGYSFTFREK